MSKLNTNLIAKLRNSGLRPTKQRIKICEILFNREKTFHFSINDLTNILANQYNQKINLYLSLPSKPNFDKISKKVNSNPKGFVTQVIDDISQVQRISDYLKPKNFELIPCVLYPSSKNARSAEFLNLDWSNYENDFSSFIREIENVAGDVLLTSPNDFKGALDFLTRLQN